MTTLLECDAKSSIRLFNDATLSDVKIIQIHDGKTRESAAHKVALCLQ